MGNFEYIQLDKLSDIITGYAFRTAITSSDSGNMRVIHAKDLRNNFYIDTQELKCIEMDYAGNRLVQKNDVILSSRGFFVAGVFISDENTIASASVYILRPNLKKILPEYLAIFLNSKKGQKQLLQYCTSTTIKSILTRDLKKIYIPLPSIEVQNDIINLYRSIEKQRILMKKKMRLQQEIFNSIL